MQAATPAEKAAVLALADNDPRFPSRVLDIARDVRTTGGSAGMRRFWLLSEGEDGTRTVIEIKELGIPGTEFGRHSASLDGPDRFDVLQAFWWDATTMNDHFGVDLLGSRWLVRDRLIRTNPKPAKLTASQRTNAVQAEASILALRHRKSVAQGQEVGSALVAPRQLGDPGRAVALGLQLGRRRVAVTDSRSRLAALPSR